MAASWRSVQFLSDEELLAAAEAAANELEELPLDNNMFTDEEPSEDEDGDDFDYDPQDILEVDETQERAEEVFDPTDNQLVDEENNLEDEEPNPVQTKKRKGKGKNTKKKKKQK